MPKRKAILLPDWLKAVLRDNRLEGSIYQHTPGYMHWKPLEKVVDAVHAAITATSVRLQIFDILVEIKEKLKQNDNNCDYSLVAHFYFPKNIPFTLILSITHDVPRPGVEHHVVFRLYRNGLIKDIERVYSTENARKRNT